MTEVAAGTKVGICRHCWHNFNLSSSDARGELLNYLLQHFFFCTSLYQNHINRHQ